MSSIDDYFVIDGKKSISSFHSFHCANSEVKLIKLVNNECWELILIIRKYTILILHVALTHITNEVVAVVLAVVCM